jgi:uncharacterized protein
MTLTKTARRLGKALSFAALLGFAAAAHAADATPEQISAARAAINAIKATDQFDLILPQAADSLRGEMIQKDPNLEPAISAAIDEEVIRLAARRADLEAEAARAYANIFSIEELNAIAAFYSSDAGKKLLAEGPLATRKVIEAANIWQAGIARDLAEAVAKKVKAAADAAPAVDAPAAEPKAEEKPKAAENPKPAEKPKKK